jgi:hypothetical protein
MQCQQFAESCERTHYYVAILKIASSALGIIAFTKIVTPDEGSRSALLTFIRLELTSLA